jgi:hypothetical protein
MDIAHNNPISDPLPMKGLSTKNRHCYVCFSAAAVFFDLAACLIGIVAAAEGLTSGGDRFLRGK